MHYRTRALCAQMGRQYANCRRIYIQITNVSIAEHWAIIVQPLLEHHHLQQRGGVAVVRRGCPCVLVEHLIHFTHLKTLHCLWPASLSYSLRATQVPTREPRKGDYRDELRPKSRGRLICFSPASTMAKRWAEGGRWRHESIGQRASVWQRHIWRISWWSHFTPIYTKLQQRLMIIYACTRRLVTSFVPTVQINIAN